MYFFEFTYRAIAKVCYIIFTRKKEERWASAYVHRLEQKYGDETLDKETFKKIVRSYAIYTLMMCDAFTSLHGRKTNRGERERMLRYFICSSLFDNFCDRKELTRVQLHDISFDPEHYPARRMEEKLFLHSHLLLKEYVQEKDAYQEVTRKLFQAQIDSDKQFDKTTSDAEIERITFEKGGYSVLLCQFYLDEEPSKAEKNCWYQAGGIIQFTNDLYDIYKDLQEHSETLPGRMKDARAFDLFFSRLIQNIKNELDKLPFPWQRKQDLMISLMGICSFGKLALQKLISIQGNNSQLPDLNTLPRKALIVDMEKPANMWYCIKFMYRHTRTWVAKQDKMQQ